LRDSARITRLAPPRLCDNELSVAQLSHFVADQCRISVSEGRRQRFAILVIQLNRSDRGSALAGLERARATGEEIRHRISSALRPVDRFAVVGIAEIIAFLPGVDSSAVIGLAGTKILKVLDQPVQIDGKSALLRPAIGCAFFPDHGTDAEQLVAAADQAGFKARALPTRIDIVRDVGKVAQHHALIDDLRSAIENNELEVWLQPQIACSTRDFVAAEALIRWPRPPQREVVHAGLIAQLAEENGLMTAMTDFVINTALRHVGYLDTQGIGLSVGVNLSASVLCDSDLPRRVGQALSIWNIPASRLTLEVTESSLMLDFEGALAVMLELKRLGTRLSIDDFGTGYSSLSYLRRMPLDELKIDQVFVRNILQNPSDIQITQSVIDLAHHFQLEAVAEGVESRRIMDLLVGFGCDLLQGYYFSKPVPVDQLVAWWPARRAMP
jgi:diguanylate cyclase